MQLLYIHQLSPIHAMDVRLKMVILALAASTATFLASWEILIVLLVVELVLFILARLTLPLKAMAKLLPVTGSLLLCHALLHSLTDGMILALRCHTLVLLGILFGQTTKISDIVEVFGSLRQANTHHGLMLALVLRFIPLLMEQTQALQEAHQARSARMWSAGLVPFVVRVAGIGDRLAEALESRGYEHSCQRVD